MLSYYDLLEASQREPMDVTPWLAWFLGCLGRALQAAGQTLAQVLAEARFCERHQSTPFTERQQQHQQFTRLLNGFEGKFTTAK